MSDLLLDNEQARKLIKTLGLPLPVPERLRRAKGPYEERPLEGKVVLGDRARCADQARDDQVEARVVDALRGLDLGERDRLGIRRQRVARARRGSDRFARRAPGETRAAPLPAASRASVQGAAAVLKKPLKLPMLTKAIDDVLAELTV